MGSNGRKVKLSNITVDIQQEKCIFEPTETFFSLFFTPTVAGSRSDSSAVSGQVVF